MKRLMWLLAIASGSFLGGSIVSHGGLHAADYQVVSSDIVASKHVASDNKNIDWVTLIDDATRGSLAISASVAPQADMLNPSLLPVRDGNSTTSLDQLLKRYARDEKLNAYRIRSSTIQDVDTEHIRLADWCKEQGLKEQEQAHLLRALEFQPDNEALRARLGHVRSERGWETPAQRATRMANIEKMERGREKWMTFITQLTNDIDNGSASQKKGALELIRSIRDPAAISSLESVLGKNIKYAGLMVEPLSKIDDPLAYSALVRLASDSASQATRDSAVAALKKLGEQRVVPVILENLVVPVQAETRVVEAQGVKKYVQELMRKNPEFTERIVAEVTMNNLPPSPSLKRDELSRITSEDSRLKQALRMENGRSRAKNARLMALLTRLTGEKNLATPTQWHEWWKQENEVLESGTPAMFTTRYDTPIRYSKAGLSPRAQFTSSSFRLDKDFQSARSQTRHECFVAGTLVWTELGQTAIEKIRTGDRVLTRNFSSGLLEFKPVVHPTKRPKEELVNIEIGCDEFHCTGGHLFWVKDQGWIKARDLKAGQLVRGAQNSLSVTKNTHFPAAETYNLVVSDNHNYFVGHGGWLTHDNTPRSPVAIATVEHLMK